MARREGVALGGEAVDEPMIAVAMIAEAVVQPAGAALPELEGVRLDAIAAPPRGNRNVASGELARIAFDLGF